MTATIAERVDAGAAFLDEHDPGWWRQPRIDLDRLDLGQPCGCVLGQLYVHDCPEPPLHYMHAMDAFDLPPIGDADADLGFDSSLEIEGEYALLTAEWKRVIEARRAAA